MIRIFFPHGLLQRISLGIICCLFIFPFSFGQKLDHRLGEIIVQIEMHEESNMAFLSLQKNMRSIWSGNHTECIIPDMHIWKVQFDYAKNNERELLNWLKQQPEVIHAQFNYFIEFRKTPNDFLFDNQWQYLNTGQLGLPMGIDLQMDEVWDIATGGVTSRGDSIVICIIDDGVDGNHRDILPNLWQNRLEIPNNGIDDDLNGYVDDYLGWNVGAQNDHIFQGGRHGTSVTGIVGAKGNNTIGVSGVNWDVKMMIISGISDIASVLSAYSYPLKMRQLYNKTGGKKGAFVVATNASWGIPNLFPIDAPLWCSFYDSLGKAGILNFGAAPNKAIDVDIKGDLPSTCTSDYFVAVTNINRFDALNNTSGYGNKSIDLGAFGEATYTTALGDNYRAFGGTSAATPHVTGSVGLLYAAQNCNNLSALALSNPAKAAIVVKDLILQHTKPLLDLSSISTTGGRLDILHALQSLTPFVLDILTDSSALIKWESTDTNVVDSIRYRILGEAQWKGDIYHYGQYLLQDLPKCSTIEIQAKGICQPGNDAWTNSFIFSTEGCCKAPDTLETLVIDSESITFLLSDIYAAIQYIVEYRDVLDPRWHIDTISISPSKTYTIRQLEFCTNYQFRIRTLCADSTSRYSDTLFVRTKGCGVCIDQTYCRPLLNPLSTSDWISRVSIGARSNISQKSSGYEDFTLTGPDFTLYTDSTYLLEVQIGNTGSPTDEILRAWIDYNQDGQFNSTEIIINPSYWVKGAFDTLLRVPNGTPEGNTRMRFMLKWPGFDDRAPEACDEIEFGEIEDYCVTILPQQRCSSSPQLDSISGTNFFNNISIFWNSPDDSTHFQISYRLEEEKNWTDSIVVGDSVTLSNLVYCEFYHVRIRMQCPDQTWSSWSKNLRISTWCVDAVEDPFLGNLQLYPNPVHSVLNISNTSKERKIKQITIYKNGQIFDKIGPIQSPNFAVSTHAWPNGLYLLKITPDNGHSIFKKVIKIE